MNTFEFLQELAGEIPYQKRRVKGHIAKEEVAARLLAKEREWWLSAMDKESNE